MSTSLYQIHSATPIQMMSYVIRTENGKLIVIDGGNTEDAYSLLDFLYSLTNGEKPTVDCWFITHSHTDHADALGEIMRNNTDKVEVKKIVWHLIDDDFFNKVQAPAYAKESTDIISNALGGAVHTAEVGEKFTVDNVEFEIIHVSEDRFEHDLINNTSMAFIMRAEGQKVLFLGDLGELAGCRVLEMHSPETLECDIVQMAHHGQDGVNFDFYKAVKPKMCLWTTPKWLWDNDAGGGYNTHTFKTVITQGWMNELGVKHHVKEYEGTKEIVLPFDFGNK